MKGTLRTMWETFNWMGKVGIVCGFFGGAVGLVVPVAIILANKGSWGSKVIPLVLTLVLVGMVYAVFIFAFRGVFRPIAVQRHLNEVGVPAAAVITALEETGVTINRIYPVVRLKLEVRPSGGEPFRAELKTMVSRLDIPQIQPGAMVEVRYDLNNPSLVALATEKEETASPQDEQDEAGFAPSSLGGPLSSAGTGPGAAAPRVDVARSLEEFLRKNDEECEEIRRSGRPAPALILQAIPLGVMVNGNNPAMTFVLEVRPEGEPAFQAQTTGVIGEAAVPKYQPGRTVYVKYDPADHSRVSLDHS